MQADSARSRPRIQKLPPDLVNQIAAGEVVERPASVVKELVENSLDSGATRIDVLLVNGGIEEITVLDNGCGMDQEDLLLSVAPHATSKLFTSNDLEAIGTYGFRGEALASIASVARMSITTRTSHADSALRLDLFQRKTIGEISPAGAPVGTRITVSRLFEHVPARYKFLRSPSTEFSHCSKMFRELALGLPQVAFHLHHNGRHLHQYVAPSTLGRLQECCSFDWTPLEISEETEDFSLHALLSPAHLPQERGDLYLFINGRLIRGRILQSAVKRVYQEVLGPYHDPSGALFLDIRRDWVDVNVHPQKWEVRILQQERLFGWLVATIRKALAKDKGTKTTPSVSAPVLEYTPIDSSTVTPPRTWMMSTPSDEKGIRFVTALQSGNLLYESASGLLIVDPAQLAQQAYEKQLSAERCEKVALEPPQVVTGSPDLLPKLGFDVEPFGLREIRVTAAPKLILRSQLQKAVQVITQSEDSDTARRALSKLLARENTPSPLEVIQLLRTLGYDNAQDSSRAVFRLDFQQIQKHFEET